MLARRQGRLERQGYRHVRVIFHDIPRTRGGAMRAILRASYPLDRLIELYTQDGKPDPPSSTAEFRAFIDALGPARWQQIDCVSGHTVQYAIPLVEEPFGVATLIRDPVERVLSLYRDLTRADRAPHARGPVGRLLARGRVSLADIYELYGRDAVIDGDDDELLGGFFDGQTRAIVAPHLAPDETPPAGPLVGADIAALTERVLSEHYVLGSTGHLRASLRRYAEAFGWATDIEPATAGETGAREGSIGDVPPELAALIREHNPADERLYQRAVAELEPYDDDGLATRPRGHSERVDHVVDLKQSQEQLAEATAALDRVVAASRRLAERLDVAWPGQKPEPAPVTARVVESVIDEATRRLDGAEGERAMLAKRIDIQAVDLQAYPIRERALETRVGQLERQLADSAREADRRAEAMESLTEERQLLAKHASDLAHSRAWRWGHGLALFVNRVTFRRTKGLGAAEMLVAILGPPKRKT